MKKSFLFLLTFLLPIVASAYDAYIDGIYYNIDTTTKTAEVTGRGLNDSNQDAYTGTLNIPASVSYNGEEYSVTRIGKEAFNQCPNLLSITIPNSIIYISANTFERTGWYNNQPDGIVYLDNWIINYKGEKPTGSLTITEGTRGVAELAFWCCDNLTNITIPNSVAYIGSRAFEGCSSLTAVNIPNGVTCIRGGTFHGCSSLTTITIPDSVTRIESSCTVNPWTWGAFAGCSGLTSVTFGSSLEIIGNEAFKDCTGLVSVTIPNNVYSLGTDAFMGCSSLTKVSLSNSISTIQWSTFSGCISLSSIYIPNSVTSIEGGAFRGCKSLKIIEIPNSVTSIGDETFSGCYGLTTIDIPNSVTRIGQAAFYRCYGLSSANIPISVNSLGNFVFKGCANLESLSIPEVITIIPEGICEGCTLLKEVTLPNNVVIIKSNAFSGCYSLKSINLPEKVEFIYQKAFYNCGLNEGIKVLSKTPPFVYNDTFNNFDVPLIVQNESIEAYKAHDIWGKFSNISDGKYKLTYVVDEIDYHTYMIEFGSVIIPEPVPTKEGYTFGGWSEIPETMPAHDVIVTGTFTINKYKLTYIVDGEEYKSYEMEFGAAITPESAPTKDGYTFSGWSEVPETMPAHDVTITGTFSINKYKLTYIVDGKDYKSYDVEYGAAITPELAPTKEGYIFSGWSKIPETMPAYDVTVTGAFTKGSYKLTYVVDGEVYKTISYSYGDVITPEPAPNKEGYTFSGWSETPKTMPAYDVTVTGTFYINSYKLTYMIDDQVYKETIYEYGTTITPEPQPEGDYATFEWIDLPEKMPAHDVVVYAIYTSGISEIPMSLQQNIRFYSPTGKMLDKPQKGLNIFQYIDGTTRKVVVK